MSKTWLAHKDPSAAKLKALTAYSPLLQRLLALRGLTTKTSVEKFLAPDYTRDLYDPFLMADMAKAVDRILSAITRQEKVIIFGDYDADGVPASVIMASFFQKVAFTNFEVYIPDRHNEAYGLSEEAIRGFAASGVKLVVTFDCGITDVAEVELADQLGIEVIITDHHLPPEKMPQAYAVVNAKRSDDTYPFKMLAGSGVAYKLVQALTQKGSFDLAPGWEKWLLDLAAIATITDMVTMTDENRALTHFGLKVLRKTRRLGLQYLFNAAKVNLAYATEDDIGFMIGPRINSASRMSHASEAYELLMTEDEAKARAIADHLEKQNKERRELVERILQEVEKDYHGQTLPAILVAGNPGWSLGVLGLTCSRLVEKYQRPVFLWSKNGHGVVKGSCRSDGSINMVDLMRSTPADFFIDAGGHAMAGGFSLALEKVEQLLPSLLTAYQALPKQKVNESLLYDAELSLEMVDNLLSAEIERLAPFGVDNPKPVFLFRNILIAEAKSFGNGGLHLELKLTQASGKLIPAIGFFVCLPSFFSEKFDGSKGHKFTDVDLAPGRRVDLLGTIEMSHFRNQAELRLRIIDLRQPE
jgi:single-stranded-DNA-specific exonuclease